MIGEVLTVLFAVYVLNNAEVCKDRTDKCDQYMKTGWYSDCTVGGYLYDYCRKSCGYCNGRPIPTPSSKCQNYEKMCGEWKCEDNPDFMKLYCKETCGYCRPKGCKDRTDQCDQYMKTGWYSDCTVGGYLYDYCRKSCGYCNGRPIPTPTRNCQNFEKNCEYWKERNQCKSNPDFMKLYCKKTCGYCHVKPTEPTKPTITTTTKTTTTPKRKCQDEDPTFCASNAAACFYKIEVMSKKCQLTCKMCSPKTECFDSNSYCPKWKENDFCKKGNVYYPFMMKTCKYTCTGC